MCVCFIKIVLLLYTPRFDICLPYAWTSEARRARPYAGNSAIQRLLLPEPLYWQQCTGMPPASPPTVQHMSYLIYSDLNTE